MQNFSGAIIGRYVLIAILSFSLSAAFGCGSSESTPAGNGEVCSAPIGVAVISNREQIKISWTTDTCAESYIIYWKEGSGITADDTQISTTTSPNVHTGLVNGTAYSYSVVAVNAAGESDLSTEVSATPWPRVFVTSASGPGKFSAWPVQTSEGNPPVDGIDGADEICEALGQQAGMGVTFYAWFSDDTHDAVCHVQGLSGKKSANCGQAALPEGPGPWYRTDDVLVANSIQDIITNNPPLLAPINVDETGAVQDAMAWTGTYYAGTLQTPDCTDWLTDSAATNGTAGETNTTGLAWTASSTTTNCSQSVHFYCFEK